jgi:hypothetical protein
VINLKRQHYETQQKLFDTIEESVVIFFLSITEFFLSREKRNTMSVKDALQNEQLIRQRRVDLFSIEFLN